MPKKGSEQGFCARQQDHTFENDVCTTCGISWVDSVRGFSVKTANFEMPSKSFRHKRIVESMGGGGE